VQQPDEQASAGGVQACADANGTASDKVTVKISVFMRSLSLPKIAHRTDKSMHDELSLLHCVGHDAPASFAEL